MTELVRITNRGGNAPVGVIVKAGENTIQQAVLAGKGDEFEFNIYPGVIMIVGELVQQPVQDDEDTGPVGNIPNPLVPNLDGVTINDPWDEPNDEQPYDDEDK